MNDGHFPFMNFLSETGICCKHLYLGVAKETIRIYVVAKKFYM
jgi:hypothetical protein